MMVYIKLFFEFFKTGLFAIGGGMATLPFLKAIGESTGWYTNAELMNMLAVSESTPGPIGINMATYVGFKVAGIPGAIVATIGEITPSIVVIILVAAILNKFKNSKLVGDVFYGLRPTSSGLIGAACVTVVLQVLTTISIANNYRGIINTFTIQPDTCVVILPAILLAAVLLVATNWIKPLKKLHPIVFIAFSAVVGVIVGGF